MKKRICTFIAWNLYCIGNLVSIPMERLRMSFLWRPYTYIMRASYKIQIWAGAEEPWKKL
jgi:hypothetical protein